MKKAIFFMLLAVAALLGCSKDDDNKLKASMSAQINSANWNTTTRVTVLNSDRFLITGTALDGKTLEITVFGTTQGTYQGLSECAAVYKESFSTTLSDAYISISGTVELTNVNTSSQEISGTFSFTLTRLFSTVTVTEGSFNNLKYTVTP